MAARNPPSASAGAASPSLPASFAMGALAACIAEATTLPLDTAKVRLQLQSLAQDRSSRKYRGPLHTMATMSREEGVASLYKGLSPGIQRQFVFTGLRLGLYDKVRWGGGGCADTQGEGEGEGRGREVSDDLLLGSIAARR